MENTIQLGKIAQDLVSEFNLAFRPFNTNHPIFHNHHLELASLALKHLLGGAEKMITRKKLEEMLAKIDSLQQIKSETEFGWLSSDLLKEFRSQLETALGNSETLTQ